MISSQSSHSFTWPLLALSHSHSHLATPKKDLQQLLLFLLLLSWTNSLRDIFPCTPRRTLRTHLRVRVRAHFLWPALFPRFFSFFSLVCATISIAICQCCHRLWERLLIKVKVCKGGGGMGDSTYLAYSSSEFYFYLVVVVAFLVYPKCAAFNPNFVLVAASVCVCFLLL